ncbi:MAG: hypothetical protein WA980_04780 [Shinella zoogloeoides]|uniref:hypothetical protein n=1 Tax=Shinella zoogloeoides TaxID=352475 RepID=UPI003C75EBB8
MPLISIWRDKPEEVCTWPLRQVIALAGDGVLLDDSECSKEFRTYLSEVEADLLARYVTECLEPSEHGGRKIKRAFENSGYVLQDIVNEIGRRLDYTVDNGVYSGRTGTVGYDGIWRERSGAALIVEVKTTDAYSIPLETVAKYRQRLIAENTVEEASSVLFVVGRDDTGSLEAQIRGSRHAWNMRMIGAASLVRLLQVKVETEAHSVVNRIRSVLRPIEYTRVDGIIDLLFDVRADVQVDEAAIEPPEGDFYDHSQPSNAQPSRSPSSPPSADIEAFRLDVADAISSVVGTKLTKRRRSWFESADGTNRAVVAVSKRYRRDYQSYWYGVYDTQRSFLLGGSQAFLALCGLDTRRVWLLPIAEFEKLVDGLNSTVRPDGQTYWHVMTKLVGDICVLVTQRGEVALTEYEITDRLHIFKESAVSSNRDSKGAKSVHISSIDGRRLTKHRHR